MTATSTIDFERFDMLRGQAFEPHVHDTHQLVWASAGVLMVRIGNRSWVLPPNLALWIPAGVRHATVALRESVMRGIYLDPELCAVPWIAPTVVSVSPLARHLIDHLAGDLTAASRRHAEAVLLDALRPVPAGTIELPLPSDPRARDVGELVLTDPADDRSLDELAHQVRSSSRTILRLFLAETGMTFSQWRTHARLQAATALLAEGQPVTRVAGRVGYGTASAFVAAFRRATGQTPAAFVQRAGGGDRPMADRECRGG